MTYTSYVTASEPRCTSIIFDGCEMLFTWSPPEDSSSISPKLFMKILRSSTWFEFEAGNLTQEAAYELVGQEFSVPVSAVAKAFDSARDSLRMKPEVLSSLAALKRTHNLSIFAMTNISGPDWAVLRTKARPEEWALFDGVFTSAEAHERKPNPGFYRRVLAATGVEPTRTVFVDDKIENVATAQSFGMRGIVFDSWDEVMRKLKTLITDPIERAQAWLRSHAKSMVSVTDNGIPIHENFAPMLILEATGDRSLVDYVEHPRLFNFFKGNAVLTTAEFPCDLDTTSIGLTVSTHVDLRTKHGVMDEMLKYRNKDGIIQTYFDHRRPRIDPIVCTNVLTFFHMHGRGHELMETQDWVYSVLLHRAYLDGTLYYYSADAFLFFLSRLVSVSPAAYHYFTPLLSQRLSERFGAAGDALALAMRVIAAVRLGLRADGDYARMLALQEADGSWPLSWVYKYGGAKIMIGNKGLCTAYALQAIRAMRDPSSCTVSLRKTVAQPVKYASFSRVERENGQILAYIGAGVLCMLLLSVLTISYSSTMVRSAPHFSPRA